MAVVHLTDVSKLATTCKKFYANLLNQYANVVNVYLSGHAGAIMVFNIHLKQKSIYIDTDWALRLLTLYSYRKQQDVNRSLILMDNKFGDLLFWIEFNPELKELMLEQEKQF
jgi:hypothetical protein